MTIHKWTQAQADSLAQVLNSLVLQIPTVRQPIAAHDWGKDYKIYFKHANSPIDTQGFLLQFDPVDQVLIGWATGFGYDLPADIVAHITTIFPYAEYYHDSGGIHHWTNISEVLLRKVVGQ